MIIDDKVKKIIATSSFICISLALILIKLNSPATGYELSLYHSLPLVTWVFLIGAIVLGTFIIVNEAFSKERTNFWYFGFLALLMSNFTILSLHYLRGYHFLTMSDPLGHLSITVSILSSGNIGTNYYPITHLMGVEIINLSGIGPNNTLKYLPVLFTILSMIFIYMMASEVSFKKEHALLAAAAGSSLLYSYYHVSTYPQALSLLTFPLFFYIYFKASNRSSIAHNTLLVILLFLFPFFHPAPEAVLIFCLVGGEIAKAIWIKKVDIGGNTRVLNKLSANPALISIAVFFTWFMSFTVFDSAASRFFYKWYANNVDDIPRFNELDTVSKLEPFDQMLLVFKMYGDQFIYLALSLIAVFIIFKNFKNRKTEYKKLFTLSFLLLVSGPVYALIFYSVGMTTIGRLAGANTVLWITPVLSGFALYYIFSNNSRSRFVNVCLVTFILISTSVLSISTVYRSPWIYQPNMQITNMDISGFGWAANYGVQESKVGYLGWPAGYHPIFIPKHFGYQDFNSIGEYIQQDTAFILTKRFRLAAENPTLKNSSVVPPGLSAQGFDRVDFERLREDATIDWIYMNGEFDVFYARKQVAQ